MQEKILVTGGAGYIGSTTVKELIAAGYEVIVVDSLENGHRKAVDSAAILEVANVGDKKKMREIIAKCQPKAIVDFAAYLEVGESMEKPEKYFQNNVANFISLLDAISETECRYIIKSSTAAAYGNPSEEKDFPLKENYTEAFKPEKSCLLSGKFNDQEIRGEEFFQKFVGLYNNYIAGRPELALTEDETTMLRTPTSVYGLSKLFDEILLQKYEKLHNLKGIALRYFNVAGAYPDGSIGENHDPETHLIPAILKTNHEFKLFGTDYNTKDGTPIRDYIHVVDLALGHIKALEYILSTDSSNTFNLGNGVGYSVFDVINVIEEVTGKKVDYIISDRRSGDPEKLIASPAKANVTLNWEAEFSLKDMISSAKKWHDSHPEGYVEKS